MRKLIAALVVVLCLIFCAYSINRVNDVSVGEAQSLLKPPLTSEEPKRKNTEQISEAETRGNEIDSMEQLMDFSGLHKENDEINYWLSIDGTNIDFPVVIGKDNKYYLTHTADNQNSSLGAIFADYRTNMDFLDFSTIFYGHNIEGGKMFAALIDFKEREFFDTHSSGKLYTPEKTYNLEIFACIVTKSTSEVYRYGFESTNEKSQHIEMLKENAKFWRDVGIDNTSKILVLSTCSYEYRDARTVVLAKIV